MSSINFPRLYAPRHRDRAAMRAQRDRNRHKTLDAPVEQSRRRADVGPESVAVWLQHLVDAVGGRPLSEILGFTNQGGPAYGIEQVVKMIEALDPDARDDTGDTCRYFANKVIAKLREIDAPWKSVETGWLIERADNRRAVWGMSAVKRIAHIERGQGLRQA